MLPYQLIKYVIVDTAIRNKSPQANLIPYKSYISSKLFSGSEVDSIYIDFEIVFDAVHNAILIEKFNKYNMPQSLLNWTYCYWLTRKLVTRKNGYVTNTFDLPNGILQGTHSTTLIFVKFMTDIAESIEIVKIWLYKNDIQNACEIETVDDISEIQNNINNFVNLS